MIGRIFGRRNGSVGKKRVKGYVEFRGGGPWFVDENTLQTYPLAENQPGIRAGSFSATVQDGKVLALERLE